MTRKSLMVLLVGSYSLPAAGAQTTGVDGLHGCQPGNLAAPLETG